MPWPLVAGGGARGLQAMSQVAARSVQSLLPARRRGPCLLSCIACAGCLVATGLAVLAGVGAVVSVVTGGAGGVQPCAAPTDASGGACSSNSSGVGRPMSCAGLRASQGFGYTTYMHTGVDLVCGPGTPVLSIASGTFERHQDSSQSPCPASLGGGLHGGYGLYGGVDD